MTDTHILTITEFEKSLIDGSTVIDLRPPETFALAYIPGSINLFADKNFNSNTRHFIFKDQAIILVCEEGKMEKNVSQLTELGFINIRGCLDGGMDEWLRKNKKIDVVISISPEELDLEIKYGNINLYDIRPTEDFDSIHVLNSENIDPGKLIENYDLIDTKSLSCIYCRDGMFSMSLISYLKKNSIHNIYHVKEGFTAINEYPGIVKVAG